MTRSTRIKPVLSGELLERKLMLSNDSFDQIANIYDAGQAGLRNS